MKKYLLGLLSLVATAVQAGPRGGVTLDAPSDGIFGPVTKFFQSIIDYAGGAGTLFIVFMSIVVGVILWIVAPKQGSAAIAAVMRAFVGAIFLFNVGVIIAYFQGL